MPRSAATCSAVSSGSARSGGTPSEPPDPAAPPRAPSPSANPPPSSLPPVPGDVRRPDGRRPPAARDRLDHQPTATPPANHREVREAVVDLDDVAFPHPGEPHAELSVGAIPPPAGSLPPSACAASSPIA